MARKGSAVAGSKSGWPPTPSDSTTEPVGWPRYTVRYRAVGVQDRKSSFTSSRSASEALLALA